MAEERISSVVAPSAFDEVERLGNEIASLERLANAVDIRIGGASSLKDLNASLKELSRLTNDAIKVSKLQIEQQKQADREANTSIKERAQALKEQAASQKQQSAEEKKASAERNQAYKEDLAYQKQIEQQGKQNTAMLVAGEKQKQAAIKATQQSDAEFQKQLEATGKSNIKVLLSIEQAQKREAKLNAEASSDYKILSKAYQDASLRAKDYALQLGSTHPLTVQAINDASAMGNTLKQLDASVGQYQRNVGNYNSVGMQFNQLLREAPNFAISWRTGLISLTNNISYFGEAVGAARKQGQGFGSILKSVGGSFTGLVGIINIAVTAITYFTLQADKVASSTGSAEKATKKYNDAIQAAGETARSSANEEIARLRVLEAVATDTTKSMKARGNAVNEMQRLYPEYLGSLKDEVILQGRAATEINAATEALLMRAQAAAAEKRFAAAAEQVYDLQLAQRKAVAEVAREEKILFDARKQGQQNTPGPFGMTFEEGLNVRIKNARENLEGINTQLREAKEIQGQFLRDAQAAGAESFDLFKPKKEPKQKDNSKTELNAWRSLMERQAKEQFDAQALEVKTEADAQLAIAKNDEASYDTRIAALTRYYELKQTIINETAEYEKFSENRTANEVEAIDLKKISNLTALTQEALDIETDAAQKSVDAENKANEQMKAGWFSLTEWWKKENDKRTKDDEEQNKKRLMLAVQSTGEVINAIAGIYSDQMANRIAQLEKEGQLIEDNGRKEIDRIQYSGKTEEEKQKAIRESEARTESQRKANDARQRDAARRKAQFDKAANISNIITSGALAVIKAYVDSGPIGAVIAGVAVSAQLARAAAAPIPAYEGGTLSHKGGAFIAGEKESELVVRPDGRTYWTKDEPTLYNEPKGTQVFNQDQINRIAMAALTPQLLRAVQPNSQKEDATKQLAKVIEKSGRDTVRAIVNNKSSVNVNTQSIDLQYLKQVKGK